MTASLRSRSRPSPPRRSPCPVSCALELFGDRWTLLVVRDLLLGKSRYKDFVASPEAIPTNILADRLAKLLQQGIVEQTSTPDSRHKAYKLTEKGCALRSVLRTMRDWGLKWEPGTRAAMEKV